MFFRFDNNQFSILVAGSIGNKRPVLSSWHKAYQKRTLSIGSEIPENNDQRTIGGAASDHTFPLALRRDPTGNQQLHSASSIDETCDTAGYLELLTNAKDKLVGEEYETDLAVTTYTRSNAYISTNTLTISSVFLGVLIIILIWCYKQKQTEYLRQISTVTESSNSTTLIPPPTPQYHQLEQPLTPSFQSRY